MEKAMNSDSDVLRHYLCAMLTRLRSHYRRDPLRFSRTQCSESLLALVLAAYITPIGPTLI